MNSTKHLIIAIIFATVIIITGTAGFMFFEGWSLLDSLYMTVITLTTVGYGEVHEISSAGTIYTICLISIGVGFYLYIASAVVQFVVEGQIRNILGRRRLDKKISKIKNHYIVCGYGRIGNILCRQLKTKYSDIVVIEKDSHLVSEADEQGMLFVEGDAIDEKVLEKAGIKRAKSLLAVLGSDTENVFLVLTARQLAKDIFIMARAGEEKTKSKLRAAGADFVESPYEIGGRRMAQRILRPSVTDFIDFALAHKRKDIQMEEMPVKSSSRLVNLSLKDSNIRQDYNLIIIAIKKPDNSMLFNPSFETLVKAGETLIAVGEVDNLEKLEKALNPTHS